MTLFCATRSWNSFPFCIEVSSHTISITIFGLASRSSAYRIGLKEPSSMIWWCDYGTSLGQRLLWNADILATPSWIHKSDDCSALRKRPRYTFQNGKWHWEWKERSSSASFQFIAFVMWHQFIISNLWVSSMWCEDCHASVRQHIEITENEFQFECSASCVFNTGDTAWSSILESLCTLWMDRKAVTSEQNFLPFLPYRAQLPQVQYLGEITCQCVS